MQPKIGSGDLDTKAKHVQEFLNEGDKVKVTIRFRGRELAHTELGYDVLKEVEKRLVEGSYSVEKAAAMDGRFMSMTLASKVAKQKSKPQETAPKTEEKPEQEGNTPS